MTSAIAFTMGQHVDNATAVVSAQTDTLNSLRVILLKLELFVTFVDRVTDVRVHHIICIVLFSLNDNTL